MGNRFSARDVLLYLLLVAILVSVWLAMIQIDRQWEVLAVTQQRLADQTRDVSEIRRQLQQRPAVSARGAAGDGAAASDWSGFRRARAATEQPDFAAGDWLVDSFPDNLQLLTPVISGDAYSSSVQAFVLDSLVTRDVETLEYLPLVAESWSVADDGMSYRFRIRPNVRFSDGEPLTADDVAFTYRFVMDERIAAPRLRAFFSRIDSVTAEGNEVVFRYTEPYFLAFEIAGTMPILAEHFYGRYLENAAAAERFNRSTGLLLGSGPYRLADPERWTPDRPIELVRNERYWGAVQPTFDRLVWKVIQNDTARLTEFRNGDLDIYRARPLDYRELLRDPGVEQRARRFEYYDARSGYNYIAWNQQRDGVPTRFADPRVREAMTLLTDRERLAEEVFLGYAKPANGPFNPLGQQIDPDLPTREFDLRKARALLAEAGFEDRDGDGVLESADGEPFRFAFTYPAASDDYKRLVLLLKDQYVRAGIILEPNPMDWPLLIEALQDKSFDAISLAWTSNFEIDLFQFFHSSQMGPGGDNFMSYSNPELDRLIEAARVELDEQKRMEIWRQTHRILWEDQPYTFLIWRSRLDFVSTRIENVERVTAGLNWPGLWRAPLEWYVPAAQQRYAR